VRNATVDSTTHSGDDGNVTDHYSSSTIDDMHAVDSRWIRQSVMLAEGVLVVVDSFRPASRMADPANNWTAGPVWHFQVADEPVACGTSNCVVAQGFNLTDSVGGVTHGHLHLMIAMQSSASDFKLGWAQGFLTGRVHPWSVYGRRALGNVTDVVQNVTDADVTGINVADINMMDGPPRKIDGQARFISVLLPFDPQLQNSTILDQRLSLECRDITGLHAVDQPCTAEIPLPTGGAVQTATVRISSTAWAVTRK
jgi:hypothetical protein